MKKLKELIEYVFTHNRENGEYDILNKSKMTCVVLSDNFENDIIDIIIDKKNFIDNLKPSYKDLIFFNEHKRFFDVSEKNDCGDYYLLTLCKLKIEKELK
jgi:hypothetical protein